jgi:hypothetical protein
MHTEEAFTVYLLAQTALTALISTRFFPDVLPQGTALPAVTYQCISDVKYHTLTGQLEMESPNYQFTVFAATRTSARAVANQIKTILSDFAGTMGDVTIQYIMLQNELPNTETASDGTIKTHTVDLEYTIYYNKE